MLPFRTKLYSTMQLFLLDLVGQNNENCRAEKHCNGTGQVRVIFTPAHYERSADFVDGMIPLAYQIAFWKYKTMYVNNGKFKVIIQHQ